MDKNSRPLEIKVKIDLKLFVSKLKLHFSLQDQELGNTSENI